MPEGPLQLLRGTGEAELRFKNSRFLGRAAPCATAAAAAEVLARLRREHEKANHHVPAWRLRDPRSGVITHRYDDDGEPGGTAGRPILQILEAQRVVDAVVVVVRYFGGIKLGAGGLVRAYSATAAAALQAAGTRPLIVTRRVAIDVPYALFAIVAAALAREGLAIDERSFGDVPRLIVEVPEARLPALAVELRDLTAGQVRVSEVPGA